MPYYSYACSMCDANFELFFTIKEYKDKPCCPACKSKATSRQYMLDMASLNMSIKKGDHELKTLGDLANRNRDRLSEDHKQELSLKHNAYKEEPSAKELPKGMTRLKKTVKRPFFKP